MKLIYIANIRIPTEKAHGLQIAEMCRAFADAGIEIELVVPKRDNPITQDLFSYYGIKRRFPIQFLNVPDIAMKGKIGFWLNQLFFSLAILFHSFGSKRETIIFTRDELSGYLLARRGYRVFYDMHGFPEHKRFFWKRSMRAMTGIVCTNEWKIRQCEEIFDIQKERMVLARNGFNRRLFAVQENKETLRSALDLSSKKPIVMYTGHLYDWKGVDVLAEAAATLPDVQFVCVGGSEREVERFRSTTAVPENMHLFGQQPHEDIPRYLAAADVLVLPNSATSKEARFSVYSTYDTSPIKMFEYMASGVPIVASDLPSICEVLSKKNAVLAAHDDPVALADGIKRVLNDPSFADTIAAHAKKDVQGYTWERRAEIIRQFIEKSIRT